MKKFGFRFLGNINNDYANEFIAAVKSQENLKDFDVYINSSGGEVSAAITIYNFIKSLPVEVHTHNFAEVSSAAMLIFLAGTIRTCDEETKFMIHPISYGGSGELRYPLLQELIAGLEVDIKNYASIVNNETNNLNGLIDIDRYLKYESLILNKNDAIKYGIINK